LAESGEARRRKRVARERRLGLLVSVFSIGAHHLFADSDTAALAVNFERDALHYPASISLGERRARFSFTTTSAYS
jgi:hypothetical protein